MTLHTTREERDTYLFEVEGNITDAWGRAAFADINTLEDELARVREELESARKVIAAARALAKWKPEDDFHGQWPFDFYLSKVRQALADLDKHFPPEGE